MNNEHPHSELIQIWIKDTTTKFQFRRTGDDIWQDVIGNPCWTSNLEYRVKPEPVAKYKFVYEARGGTINVTINRYKDTEEFKACNIGININWAEPINNTKLMVQQ